MQFIEYKNSTHKKELKKLYHDSFPREERAPFLLHWRATKRPGGHLWEIQDGGAFAGLMAAHVEEDMVLIQYLAIDPARRGEGVGSKALQHLQELYPNSRICLNMEPLDPAAPNYEERRRRTRFYEKNGFTSMGYTINEFHNDYEMLSNHTEVSYEEFKTLNNHYFGKLWYTIISHI